MSTFRLSRVLAATLATAFLASQMPLAAQATTLQGQSENASVTEQTKTALTQKTDRFLPVSAGRTIHVANSAWASCKYDFKDVPPKTTQYKAITWMACSKIADPSKDGKYRPTQALSRGEAAVFLYRMSGEKHTSTKSFKDVKSTSSEATAISWMKSKKLVTSYSDGTFRTKNNVSRGEFATYLYKLSRDTKYKKPARATFKDIRVTSGYHTPVSWLSAKKITQGYSDRTFRPTKAISRADAAQFMYGYTSWKSGTPTPPAKAPLAAHVGLAWTKADTGLYKSNSYRSTVLVNAKINQQVELMEKIRGSGTMTKVRIGRTAGWMNSDLLSIGKMGSTSKPYPKPTNYVQGASNNVAPWCWNVPTTTRSGLGGEAGYSRTSSRVNSDDFSVNEYITLGSDWKVNHPGSIAIQLHECAHILQYRIYKYDYEALEVAMDRVSGTRNTGMGVEYMADCMADAMGAVREGRDYVAGYGEPCSSTQMTAARKLLAGQKV